MEADPFAQIQDGRILLEIMEGRFPQSVGIYNVIMMQKHAKLGLQVYVLNGEISSESWIVTICHREDVGAEISVSAPQNPVVTQSIKMAFQNARIFDWRKPYSMTAIDRSISHLFYDLSVNVFGNSICVYPCYFFIHEASTSSQIELLRQATSNANVKDDIELRTQDVETGSKFVVDLWKYSRPGTMEYMNQLLSHCPSSGLYLHGELVSGIVMGTCGMFCMLITRKGHRGQGFAKLCCRDLIRKCALEGLIPASTVEINNETSIAFHKGLGMEISHVVDYFDYIPDTI